MLTTYLAASAYLISKQSGLTGMLSPKHKTVRIIAVLNVIAIFTRHLLRIDILRDLQTSPGHEGGESLSAPDFYNAEML